MNNRTDRRNIVRAKQNQQRTPTLIADKVTPSESAKMKAEAYLDNALESLNDAGLDATAFITEKAGIQTGTEIEIEWTLMSGKKAKFKEITIASNEVKSKTYVEAVNGRNQDDLTEESLADIIASIKIQQYYPVIAQLNDGKFNIMDGSRRRMSSIFAKRPLKVLYTSEDLTPADAKALITELQSALEYSLRDLGKQYQEYMDEQKCDQKDTARAFGISTTKVSNALCAWRTNLKWLTLFPKRHALSISNYKDLTKFENIITDKSLNFDSLLDSVTIALKEIPEDIKDIERLKLTMSTIKTELQLFIKAPKKPVVKKTPLHEFKDKNQYARIGRAGEKVDFQFSRIDKALIDDIQAYIRDKLTNHYEQEK